MIYITFYLFSNVATLNLESLINIQLHTESFPTCSNSEKNYKIFDT
jgi:hypothetical protein